MTPRGSAGPEADWDKYGVLEIIDLCPFSPNDLEEYFRRLIPLYQEAYSLSAQIPEVVLSDTMIRWRRSGDDSARSAQQAVIETLDKWRTQSPSPA